MLRWLELISRVFGFKGNDFTEPSKGGLEVFRPTVRLVYYIEVNNSNYIDYLIEGNLCLYLLEFVSAKGEVFIGKVLKVD